MKAEAVEVEAVVRKVLGEILGRESADGGGSGIFSDMDKAVEAAWLAQKQLVRFNLEARGRFIEAIRSAVRKNAELLARMAVDETGMGRYEDKIKKNLLAANKTPGIEDLTSEAFSGDDGLTLVELSPFGVIGAITPTTNPSETIICNSIGMIAAGNTVVFSPHPTAKDTSIRTVEILNKAITESGGPCNLVTTVKEPTMEQVGIMMKHRKINMLAATGGPAVVRAVLSSGKKAIGAGAGNPPVVVDDTADIEKAAKDIIDGCSFDNNLPCIAEKEVIVMDNVADYLIFCMKKHGAYELKDAARIKKLQKLVIDAQGHPNKAYIGKNADYILSQLSINCLPCTRAIIMEVEREHPFVTEELMMPILPIVRVKDIDEAIGLAVEVEHGFRHTAMMHSRNVEHLTRLAKEIQTTIFVKNGPSYSGIGVGGEGYTTFTIAGPTGEGLTSAKNFARRRRCTLVGGFSIK
ncbi:MAG TPA: aldehyde dehydrogenase family protein [Negativicutes bacterium]|nr:aldehyde dehydrogenase family protein [Negativicutes bacterium]